MQFKSFKSDAPQLAAISLALLLVGTTGSAFAFKGEQYFRSAQFRLEHARAVALLTQADTVADGNMDRDGSTTGGRPLPICKDLPSTR